VLLPLTLAACASSPSAAATTPATPQVPVSSPAASPIPTPASRSPLASAPDPNPPLAAAAVAAPPTAVAELPRGTMVLHIGDSFAAALGIELGKRLKAAGLRTALEFKTASYIPNWSFDEDVPRFLGKYNPDLVLITLGANEIEIPNPEQRAGAIKHLVRVLGGRPCVWITPPLWKQDTGLMKVIRENVAPCRCLDSDTIVHDLPRAKDKIHPSTEGRATWADAVLAWLEREREPAGERPWSLKPAPSAPAQ
jgi:lysophospholipase L1-like esterase